MNPPGFYDLPAQQLTTDELEELGDVSVDWDITGVAGFVVKAAVVFIAVAVTAVSVGWVVAEWLRR